MYDSPPLVSVVIATYNRSNVLRYTIQSVINQTLADWELLVIGDCCTDDTADVVASFGDERISFYNLPENCGEQSGPNNEGVRRALGRYIAFLNHDDLWFPDHLETAAAAIEEKDADLVFTLSYNDWRMRPNDLYGAAPDGRYEPHIGVPASCWLFRREMYEDVGPWRSGGDIHNIPSQDWLFRAYRAGKKMLAAPRLTVVRVIAGSRKDVYANQEYKENERYFRRMRESPDFRSELYEQLALNYARAGADTRVWPFLKRALVNTISTFARFFRRHTYEVIYLLRYRRKGAYLRKNHYFRGLRSTNLVTRKKNE